MIDPSTRQRLESVVISPDATIAEALQRLDHAGTGAVVLCSAGNRLYGLLTDGDVRRAVMHATRLDARCSTIANRTPIVCVAPCLPAEALHLMNQYNISHLPVIDEETELKNFLLRKDLASETELEASARQRLEKVIIPPNTPISEAIERLDQAGTGVLLLCATGRRLCGLLTDGDIRRALLQRVPLEKCCEEIASKNPVIAHGSQSIRKMLHLMNRHDIDHLPVVDAEGDVVELLLHRDLIGVEQLDLAAVVMAGGFGKRLLPLTEQVPKPMLPVGDRPLLELTIQKLRNCGIRDVKLTTHYLPEHIVGHFGDGEAFGVSLTYLNEDHPMGTAGGLKLMPRGNSPLLVINGDILTKVPFREMLGYHRKHRAEITVGVRKYELQVPYGVVQCDAERITSLQEKPSLSFFINAGMYILEPTAWDLIPEGEPFDMTDLIRKLLGEGRPVVSFPVMEYWLDVGQHEDYQRAQEDVRKGRI